MKEHLHKLKSILLEKGELSFRVRVSPGKTKTKWKGIAADGILTADIHARAKEGEANAELIHFLSQYFDAPQHNISLVGGKSRNKLVKIDLY